MGPHSTHGYTYLYIESSLSKENNLPSSRIDPGTNGPLGVCWNDGAPHHPRFYLYIVVGFILTTDELLCLTLHEECIA